MQGKQGQALSGQAPPLLAEGPRPHLWYLHAGLGKTLSEALGSCCQPVEAMLACTNQGLDLAGSSYPGQSVSLKLKASQAPREADNPEVKMPRGGGGAQGGAE